MLGSTYKGDRRSQMRYDLASRIKCCTLSNPHEEIEGLTCNISISGLCIDIDRPVSAGQYLSITKCILPYFQGVFSVRWVEKVDTRYYDRYRVGLLFRDSSNLLP
jgi:hypothetical protein